MDTNLQYSINAVENTVSVLLIHNFLQFAPPSRFSFAQQIIEFWINVVRQVPTKSPFHFPIQEKKSEATTIFATIPMTAFQVQKYFLENIKNVFEQKIYFKRTYLYLQ